MAAMTTASSVSTISDLARTAWLIWSVSQSQRIDAPRLGPTVRTMRQLGFTYWQDGEHWLGFVDEYPDYVTQGASFEDLKEHLLDLYQDFS